MKAKAPFGGILCDFQAGQKQLVLSVMQNEEDRITHVRCGHARTVLYFIQTVYKKDSYGCH